MQDDEREAAHKAALAMLDIFASVTASHFDLTLTNLRGEKVRFRGKMQPDELRRALPALLDDATRQGHNIIVRPHGMNFIQLDDLDADRLDKVLPAAFLALETSPGNFQAWIVTSAGADEDLARRLRKGAGADPSASGATRIAGSRNFKPKYAPDFPTVEIAHSSPGLIVTTAQLQALGIVAPPEKATDAPPARPGRAPSLRTRPGPDKRRWPNYERCLLAAPPNHDNTGPKRSHADFVWSMTAIDWGWSIEDTAARLMEESQKAQANGENYALITAQNAAAAVARRSQQR